MWLKDQYIITYKYSVPEWAMKMEMEMKMNMKRKRERNKRRKRLGFCGCCCSWWRWQRQQWWWSFNFYLYTSSAVRDHWVVFKPHAVLMMTFEIDRDVINRNEMIFCCCHCHPCAVCQCMRSGGQGRKTVFSWVLHIFTHHQNLIFICSTHSTMDRWIDMIWCTNGRASALLWEWTSTLIFEFNSNGIYT